MRFALHCAAAAMAVLAASSTFARTEILKTQAGSPVHWAGAEIVVGLDAAGSRTLERMDVVHAIQRAAHAWNRIPADQPRFRFTTEPGQDVTIRFCRVQWQGDAIDLGKTRFDASPRDGAVVEAEIELNECDHRFTRPGERANGPFDLQSVLTHEFGHVLGLGHSDSASAVMFPSGKGVFARLPDRDDETALAVLYIGRQPPSLSHVPAREEERRGIGASPGTPTLHTPFAPSPAPRPTLPKPQRKRPRRRDGSRLGRAAARRWRPGSPTS